MQRHTLNYLQGMGFDSSDTIFCEVCGKVAVDIAHIVARSKFGSKRKEEQDDITNLCAMCRDCHYDYDFKNRWTKEEIFEIHLKNIPNGKR
jgi:5-methylcytosine-specific restriction endonuclease McrA